MVLLIIIPMINGYFIGNIPYFQTSPYPEKIEEAASQIKKQSNEKLVKSWNRNLLLPNSGTKRGRGPSKPLFPGFKVLVWQHLAMYNWHKLAQLGQEVNNFHMALPRRHIQCTDPTFGSLKIICTRLNQQSNNVEMATVCCRI